MREKDVDRWNGEEGREQPKGHWIHFVYFQVICLNSFASVVAKVYLWRGTMSFVSCLRHNTVITKLDLSLKKKKTTKEKRVRLRTPFEIWHRPCQRRHVEEIHAQFVAVVIQLSRVRWLHYYSLNNDYIIICCHVAQKRTNKQISSVETATAHPGKPRLKMTTEGQREGRAIASIHQNHSQAEAIYSEGREEKYHQYLTLFYGEATWFRPGSCAGDQRQSITIDKICVQGRPSHFVLRCAACVWSCLLRDHKRSSLVSVPSSLWLPAIIIASLPLKRKYPPRCIL